jgi:hypothetical protein
MPVGAEKKSEIHRKLLVVALKNQSVTFEDSKRKIGNLAKEINESPEEIAEVLGELYQEAVSETFNSKNFQKKTT